MSQVPEISGDEIDAVLPSQPPTTSGRPRRAAALWRITRVVAVVYLSVLVLLMFLEEWLMFFPTRYPGGNWRPAGLEFEDVEFQAQDGVRLHGWYCPVAQPRAVVLMSHGNAGNLSHRADEIRLWQEHLSVSAFIYDYRGYGRSEGSPNERGLYADARGAYRYLTEQKKVSPDQIVLRGESIGGAVSLELGVDVPHRALIMESPFTSAVDVGAMHYPWLPVRWVMRNRFESLDRIGRYSRPLFIAHGTRDSLIPFEMGRRLFDAANEPKHFYPIEDADHNDVLAMGGRGYFDALRRFLDDVDAASNDR